MLPRASSSMSGSSCIDTPSNPELHAGRGREEGPHVYLFPAPQVRVPTSRPTGPCTYLPPHRHVSAMCQARVPRSRPKGTCAYFRTHRHVCLLPAPQARAPTSRPTGT
eukprot:gene7463-biopygen8158